MQKRICKQCGKEFELSDSEKEFYKSKGLELPKRCSACRAENKNGKKSSAAKRGAVGALAAMVAAIGIYAGSALNNNTATEPSSPPVVTEQMNNAYEKDDDTPQGTITDDALGAQGDDIYEVQDDNVQENGDSDGSDAQTVQYRFRNQKTLKQHFEKHGGEFDGKYATAEEYEAGASAVVNSPDALHKTEKEDGDDVYYIEATNEFVIVSVDGYIRTYFKPSAGIAYYNRQ